MKYSTSFGCWAVALGMLAACSGDIGGTPPTPDVECAAELAASPSPLRRLTHREYVRTVADLLGYESAALAGFASQAPATGFDNQASKLGVTPTTADDYFRAAEQIAAEVAASPGSLLSCDPASAGEDACAEELITTLGRRAFRRPLDSDQIERLTLLFQSNRDAWGYAKGIELVVAAILQSPYFLYRVETAGTPAGRLVALDSWEIATRLSYFLWGTMPDEALFAAAEAGELATPEGVAAEADRMMADPRAREAAGEFHQQWLGLGALLNLTKDSAVYPEFDDAFKAAALEETRRFTEHVVFDGEGDLNTLLVGSYSFVDAALADTYGVEPPPADFDKVSLPSAERAGILTQASFLAVTSKPNQTSPVARGKAIRELFYCETLPEPPPGVDTTPPAIDPNATTRERFNQHSTDPSCAGCHRLMDPIGFGFEHYDAIGRWRDDEGGKPIDATGTIEGPDVDFDGALELAKILAADPQVQACFVRNWFTWTYGRPPEEVDACTLDELGGELAASEGNIRALMRALVTSDTFRHRAAMEGE